MSTRIYSESESTRTRSRNVHFFRSNRKVDRDMARAPVWSAVYCYCRLYNPKRGNGGGIDSWACYLMDLFGHLIGGECHRLVIS